MAPKQKPGKSFQDYQTPQNLIDAALKLIGDEKFTIDLAADAPNSVAEYFITKEQDSLAQDWTGINGFAWCNPPYQDLLPWVKKAYECKKKVVMLVPASVGANWWRDWVHQKCEVFFLNGRVGFLRGRPTWLYPKDLALLVYGVGVGQTDKGY